MEEGHTYDGFTWNAGNVTVAGTQADLFQRIGSVIGSSRSGRSARIQIGVTASYASSSLPLARHLTGLSFDYRDGRAQRSDVRYNPATSAAMVRRGLVRNDDYTFSAVLPDEQLKGTMSPLPAPREPPAVRRLPRPADQAVGEGRADASPQGAVAGALPADRRPLQQRRCGRGGGLRPGHDVAGLGKGFFGSQRPVGDDEQYAAFMALAANRLGVPARVVVGARPGAQGVGARARRLRLGGAAREGRVVAGAAAVVVHGPPRAAPL